MLTIFCEKITNRHRYIFDWIFGQFAIPYKIKDSLSDLDSHDRRVVLYTLQKAEIQNGIWVKSEGLLDKVGIQNELPIVSGNGRNALLYKNVGDLGFDIFSAVFYMISRYEEYLPYQKDVYGRFSSKQSLAYKNHFLEIPIVDYWLLDFKIFLQKHFPELIFKSNQNCSSLFTYDIDIGYKYKGRGFFRQVYSIAKNTAKLRVKHLGKRFKVIAGWQKDPWDNYQYLKQKLADYKVQSVFFFLVAKNTKYDHNLSPSNLKMRNLVKFINSFSTVGLHPSFYSSMNFQKIKHEKKRLETITGHEIENSRQHFLKFIVATIYPQLLDNGIKMDYSMGFPDAPGFRSGTTFPFNYYDLKNEKELPIKIFSPCWMDATFTNYREGNPIKALEAAKRLVSSIKEVDGLFIPIFHNDILGRKEWMDLHDNIINLISKK